MPPSPLQQRRAHNTLLFQKLLNLREGASPFTLVLDTLEQSGAPLIAEFVRRAKVCLFIYYSVILPLFRHLRSPFAASKIDQWERKREERAFFS